MVGEKAGLKQIRMDEMVQICMVVPMAATPLPWDSKELAALTAYVGRVQKGFAADQAKTPAASNPCAPKNPCSPKR
jgi:cytochrome c